jgi:hypothetical protein
MPFWIGYKHEKYWGHELPEAALVAELRESLFAAINRGHSVRCEVSYKDLGRKVTPRSGVSNRPAGGPDQADLVLYDESKQAYAVIEVKRGHSIDTEGREDLDYLHDLRKSTIGQLSTYFVLFSEAKRPRTLVSESGAAKRKINIKKFGGKIAIRRVLRAIGYISKGDDPRQRRAIEKRKSQHWAILIEVL